MSKRWIIVGTLETLSPLSIHTGELENNLSLIEMDDRGQPFIPATAIKGLVRAIAAERGCNAEAIRQLLGDKPQGDDIKQSTGASAEFGNGFTSGATLRKRQQTAIHEGAGTKRDEHLREEYFAVAGTKFDVEIILDRADQDAAQLLVDLMASVDGASEASAIGSHTGQGFGLVRWHCESARYLGPTEIATWLASDCNWRDCATSSDLTGQALTTRTSKIERFAISMPIDGHFLTAGDEVKVGDNKVRHPFAASARRRAQLMGSGFDGPLKHQANKILRTLGKATQTPSPLELLFGTTKAKGLVSVTLFEGKKDQNPVQQEMVALDRFHGGAADQAKFAVSAYEAPTLEGHLEICFLRSPNRAATGKTYDKEERKLTPEALGLLALTLWDLDEGDIRFGLGTRKGWGQPKGIGLAALLNALGEKAKTNLGFDGSDGQAVIENSISALRNMGSAS